MYIHYFDKKKPGETWVLSKKLIPQVPMAGTCSTQNMHPDLHRPVITSDSDPQVSIPTGFPMGIPVVSHG